MLHSISGKAKVAGVIGYPVSHSLSPALHGYWLNHYGIDGAYIPLPIAPYDIAAIFPHLPKMGLVGCNITIPHKEAILTLVEEVDAIAQTIGAANTIRFEAGKSIATNTDAYGFSMSLHQADAQWQTRTGQALVLGAGGAARAILYSLLQSNFSRIVISNRTEEKAQKLQQDFSILAQGRLTVLPWQAITNQLPNTELLVNTTALGMHGQPPLTLDITSLPSHALVADIVYNPLTTPLLKQAKNQGLAIADGLDMLLYQAQEGFSQWFGQRPQVTPELRQYLLDRNNS